MLKYFKQWIYGKSKLLEYIDIQIDITSKCNLSCKYCYNSTKNNKSELTVDQLNKILTQYQELLKSTGMKPSIILSGGDPFLHSNLELLLETISNFYPNFPISILTNGTTFQANEIYISLLKKFSCSIQISIDGYDANTHDQVRGAGTFNTIVKNTESLILNQIPVTFQVVLSKDTSKIINQLFEFAKKIKITTLNFTRLISSAGAGNTCVLNPQELKQAYQEIVSARQKFQIYSSTNLPLMTLIDSKLGMNHRAGMHAIVVDYNGDLRPTSRADFVVGNIFKSTSTIKKIFLTNPIMKRLRSRKINICGKCPHFRMCGGDRNASFAQYGKFFEKDPGCWI